MSLAPRPLLARPVTKFVRQVTGTAMPAGLPAWTLVAGALVLLASLVGAGIFGFVSTFAGVDMMEIQQHQGDSSTEGLTTSLVAQSFRANRPNLSRIDLQLSHVTSLNKGGVVTLYEGDGKNGRKLFQKPLGPDLVADNPYLTLKFAPVGASLGQTYTVAVETPGSPLSRSVSLVYRSVDSLSSGSLYTDAGPQAGDLSIITYYRYTPTTLWGDIKGVISGSLPVTVVWFLLLFLPGFALLSWLPVSLSPGQSLLAAPALSALALPVIYLLCRAVGLQLGGAQLWVFLALCAVLVLVRAPLSKSVRLPLKPSDVLFWSVEAAVVFIGAASKLIPLRDIYSGVGLDAYHHTMISALFARSGGIPSSYEPFAPIASFTYHFGFHALVATAGMLSGQTSPASMLTLMPQAGQISSLVAMLSVTAFGWKVLGSRWAGLAAGAITGTFAIVPAFYVNWSRYTQGLGLAVLPVAWLLALEAMKHRPASGAAVRSGSTWKRALERSGSLMLAVVASTGIFLIHYRITLMFITLLGLYLIWLITAGIHQRALRGLAHPLRQAVLVGVLSVAALAPWLVNLYRNFTVHFLGRTTTDTSSYYNVSERLGLVVDHQSVPLMLILAAGIAAWVFRRRDPLPALPLLSWLLLYLWSDPYLLPIRLPGAGYLDTTTVLSGAWLPLSLGAGYTLSRFAFWFCSLVRPRTTRLSSLWPLAASAVLIFAFLGVASGSALQLAPLHDIKLYMTRGDLDAINWLRDHLPPRGRVLANPFAFPWSPDSVLGSDAGLWIPLLTEHQSTVPSMTAYNEKLENADYLNDLRSLVGSEPFGPEYGDQAANWDALKKAGITHVFVGSRGGALSVQKLLNSEQAALVFHKDAAWVFKIR